MMDNIEIVNSFKLAKNRNQQINVLAELNGCSTQEILNILQENGCISGLPSHKKDPAQQIKQNNKQSQKHDWTPELIEQIRMWRQEGLTWPQIQERTGIPKQAIISKMTRLEKQLNQTPKSVKQQKPASPILPAPPEVVETAQSAEKLEIISVKAELERVKKLNQNMRKALYEYRIMLDKALGVSGWDIGLEDEK